MGKILKFVQRSPLFYAPGLVKFVPDVARLICLALPGSFLTMFAQNKGDLCILKLPVPATTKRNSRQHECLLGFTQPLTSFLLIEQNQYAFTSSAVHTGTPHP